MARWDSAAAITKLLAGGLLAGGGLRAVTELRDLLTRNKTKYKLVSDGGSAVPMLPDPREEKAATLLPALLGAGIGAYHAAPGKRLEGAGRGTGVAVTTDIGGGLGGVLGGLGGAAVGGGLGYLLSPLSHGYATGDAAIAPALIGGGLGTLAGVALGGREGFRRGKQWFWDESVSQPAKPHGDADTKDDEPSPETDKAAGLLWKDTTPYPLVDRSDAYADDEQFVGTAIAKQQPRWFARPFSNPDRDYDRVAGTVGTALAEMVHREELPLDIAERMMPLLIGRHLQTTHPERYDELLRGIPAGVPLPNRLIEDNELASVIAQNYRGSIGDPVLDRARSLKQLKQLHAQGKDKLVGQLDGYTAAEDLHRIGIGSRPRFPLPLSQTSTPSAQAAGADAEKSAAADGPYPTFDPMKHYGPLVGAGASVARKVIDAGGDLLGGVGTPDSALDVPATLGLGLPLGALAAYGGYSAVDALADSRRRGDREQELETVKGLYAQTLRDALLGQKAASAGPAVEAAETADEVEGQTEIDPAMLAVVAESLDDVPEAEKQGGFGEVLGEGFDALHGNKGLGLYLALASLGALGAGKLTYDAAKSRSDRALVEKAMRQREKRRLAGIQLSGSPDFAYVGA